MTTALATRAAIPHERGSPTDDAGVNDIHFHPVEPRSFRLTLNTTF